MPTTDQSTRPALGSYTEHLEDEVLRLECELATAQQRIAALRRRLVRLVPRTESAPLPAAPPPVWRPATCEIVWRGRRCALLGRQAQVMAELMDPPGHWRGSHTLAALLGMTAQSVRAAVHHIRVQLARAGIDPALVLDSRGGLGGGVRALIEGEAPP